MRSGPKPNLRRKWYIGKFKLRGGAMTKPRLTDELLEQLTCCKSVSAQRILLGVTRKRRK